MKPTFLALLALAACQPQAPDGSQARPPADAPAPPPTVAEPPPPAPTSAFSGDIDAHGTEPFWAVEIRADQIGFKTPEASIAFPTAKASMSVAGDVATWESAAGDKPIKIVLRVQPGCSDGMSDLRYPLAAEVALGGTTYKGCAAKTSEKPTERP